MFLPKSICFCLWLRRCSSVKIGLHSFGLTFVLSLLSDRRSFLLNLDKNIFILVMCEERLLRFHHCDNNEKPFSKGTLHTFVSCASWMFGFFPILHCPYSLPNFLLAQECNYQEVKFGHFTYEHMLELINNGIYL